MSKIRLVVLFVVTVSLFACHSNKEKNVAATETNAPGDEFSATEDKLTQDSLNIELRTMLAAQYYAKGQLMKASYHFLKVLDHDKKNMVALTNLGNIYYDSQQNEKAIEYYEKALAIDSNNLNTRSDLATCYSNTNQLDKAIELLKGNLRIDSRHEKSHYNLSVLLKKAGDEKGAEKEMRIYKLLITENKPK